QSAAALADDLVARRERDQMPESLQRHGHTVPHVGGHRIGQRRDLRPAHTRTSAVSPSDPSPSRPSPSDPSSPELLPVSARRAPNSRNAPTTTTATSRPSTDDTVSGNNSASPAANVTTRAHLGRTTSAIGTYPSNAAPIANTPTTARATAASTAPG